MKIIKKLSQTEMIIKVLYILGLIYSFLALLFSRSFVGVYFLNYRFGELVMLISAISLVYFTFLPFSSNKIVGRLRILNIGLFIIFGINLFLSNSSILNPYSFKTSTYIWSLGFLLIGIFGNKFEINNKSFLLFIGILVIVYLTAIYGFPSWIQELFLNYSDKYEPHKAADIVLMLIIFSTYIKSFFDHNFSSLCVHGVLYSLFLPLLLYKSRASFIAASIFFVYLLFLHRREFITYLSKSFLLIITCFVLATFSTIFAQRLVIEEFSPEEIGNSYSQLGEYKFETYKEGQEFLYIENERLFSADGNLNWRLQMWQDQISFVPEDGNIITGVGHKEILRVFNYRNFPSGNNRRGLDGLNENLHNFFVTLYARGGLITLMFYLYLYYFLIKNTKQANFFDFIVSLFCIFFVSSFDSSMENAHFPLIFYFFIGNYFFKNNLKDSK